MQVCAVSFNNYIPPKRQQQVAFQGLSPKKVASEEELMQQTFQAAINYGINIIGKDFRTVARELIETQDLLKQAKAYGFTPFSQELSELREELANAKKLFVEAQSYGINTAGKSINDVICELNAAKVRAKATAGNPFSQRRAAGNKVVNPQTVTSMRELLESGPKTKQDAILIFNALGTVFKVNSAEVVRAEASAQEIKIAYRQLALKIHSDTSPKTARHMQLLNQAKDLLPK